MRTLRCPGIMILVVSLVATDVASSMQCPARPTPEEQGVSGGAARPPGIIAPAFTQCGINAIPRTPDTRRAGGVQNSSPIN